VGPDANKVHSSQSGSPQYRGDNADKGAIKVHSPQYTGDNADKVHSPQSGSPQYTGNNADKVHSPQSGSPQSGDTATEPSNSGRSNSGLRALSIFLIFLVLAPGATWALAPAPVRDFWKAEWQGDASAYADYVATYKDATDPKARRRVEKARYFKAEQTMALPDLRDYQTHYADRGEYKEAVMEKIATLELRAVESLKKQPDAPRFDQYIRDFPDGQRWQEVKQIAAEQPEARRSELLPRLEQVAVQTLAQQPALALARNVLTTFPQAALHPELRQTLAANQQ